VSEHQATVFVVDDDAAFRDSLAALLHSMGFATSCHASGEEFLDVSINGAPSCVILDLKLPTLDGFHVLEALAKRPHAPPTIIMTGVNTVPDAVRAMRLGVVSYLQKQTFSEATLWESVQQALARDAQRRAASARRAAMDAKLKNLTGPERLVLELLLRGKEQIAIAEILGISRRTVDNRRNKIMEKLDVKTLPELIAIAVEAGLVESL
jgi:FixJ family two-component response regulator